MSAVFFIAVRALGFVYHSDRVNNGLSRQTRLLDKILVITTVTVDTLFAGESGLATISLGG
jgi:hypothetical protein